MDAKKFESAASIPTERLGRRGWSKAIIAAILGFSIVVGAGVAVRDKYLEFQHRHPGL